ncbi:MAG TPA: class I SAM-dependent methyltransferase [Longilinea sp.]|nr:class I SAM-dependent methyltransferase [Longilinea sp.]
MEQSTNQQNSSEFYAQTYDDSVSDWPGEIEFYRGMAAKAKTISGSVLEIACGTGRVAIRLAQDGVNVCGLDLSSKMIDVARRKSAGRENIRWVEGDMRNFQLQEKFDLALIPGHSFQNLNDPQDQAACLESIRRHLKPGGMLVVHLDHMNLENMIWLGELCGEKRGVFEEEEQFKHPQTGRQTRALRAWSYEPSTQTAITQTIWEEMDGDGQVVNRVEGELTRLHCIFRFEMEHLLAHAGFAIESVYGDFFRQELQDDSPSMVWVAKTP